MCFCLLALLFTVPAISDTASPAPTQDSILTSNIDYVTIRQYIQTHYKKITAEQSHLISWHIVNESLIHQMDPKLIAAIIAHESNFNPNAVGRGGSKGLGQIMPVNYQRLSITNPFDIQQNVSGTVQYMKKLLELWKEVPKATELALASYNRGYRHIKLNQNNLSARTNYYISDILKRYAHLEEIQKNLNTN